MKTHTNFGNYNNASNLVVLKTKDEKYGELIEGFVGLKSLQIFFINR